MTASHPADPEHEHYHKHRSAFSASFMSNAKWRRVLRALADAGSAIERSEWKFIDSDRIEAHGLPRATDILEDRFADGPFQPVAYKWVEWVRFPATFRPHWHLPYERAQDLGVVRRVLESCGRLMIEESADGLILRAYRR